MPMTQLKFKIRLPMPSLLLLAGGFMALLVFFLVFLYPAQRQIPKLEQKIRSLALALENQRNLAPIYETLENRLKEIRGLEGSGVSAASNAKLTQQDINDMQSRFNKLANGHHLEMKSIAPDINSLIGDPHYLLVNMNLTGGFFDLRDFLRQMITESPALEHLETIRLVKSATAAGLEIELKIGFLKEG